MKRNFKGQSNFTNKEFLIFSPEHQYASSLCCSISFPIVLTKRMSHNQELLEFVVISFVLKTFMFDLA